MKRTFLVGVLMILTLALTTMASAALPVEIQEVQVNDVVVQTTNTNRLVLERGEEFEVKVLLKATQNAKDVELEAFISGFEHNSNSEERLSASTGLFDAKANETRVKTLRLRLPQEVQSDSYKLRIIASDRNDQELIQNYNLEVEAERHKLTFEDVIFAPGKHVKSGQALLTTVRLENNGQKEEEDVKVTVSVPDLGVSVTDYINKIKVDQEEETEEMYLKLPKCADPKQYDVKVDVWYNEGRNHMQKTDALNVLENESCKETTEEPKKTEVVIVQQTPPSQPSDDGDDSTSAVRKILEGVLLVLVALLVVVGLIIGFTRLGKED